MNKKLRKAAMFFIEQARSQQTEIHSQWFYFNQDISQQAHVGSQLIERHDHLDEVVEGFNAFMWHTGQKDPRPATARQASFQLDELQRHLSDLIYRSARNDQDVSKLIAAREYIASKRPQAATLSFLEDKDLAV